MIPKWDPTIGPRITEDMWPEIIDQDLTVELLRNIQDPAGFMNARVDRLSAPTKAVVVNLISGVQYSVNAEQLSLSYQALAMQDRLAKLGYRAELGWPEMIGSMRYSWGQEQRRPHQIGELNVAMLLRRYARYPVEVADAMSRAEIAMLTRRED